MDHLPLPRDPISPHPRIWLYAGAFMNPGPFLTFPDRHGSLLRGSHPNVPTQADARAGVFAAAVSSRDVLDYYQGWLFFSLLGEFLGDGIYRFDRYVDPELDDRRERIVRVYLDTRLLHEDLARWRTEGGLRSIARGDEYHRHLDECLDKAEEVFRDLEESFPGLMAAHRDEVLSLAAVAETLDAAIETALQQGPIGEDGTPGTASRGAAALFPAQAGRSWLQHVAPTLDLTADPLNERMLAAGWCPGDISRVTDSFHTIAALYYFSNYKPDAANPHLHRNCAPWGCTLALAPQAQHVSPDCTCPGMIRFPEESLVEIYDSGAIPCFSLGRAEDGAISVALSSIRPDPESQRDPANRFVALSHVWSEGMGNPGANALPLCQLASAQRWAMMAHQLVEGEEAAAKAKEADEGGSDPRAGIAVSEAVGLNRINLWIDTMCCPATPGYGKNACLARMRDIYVGAFAVLVRSAALESLAIEPVARDPSKGVVDVASRLWLSPWMRRMWTLQEGVLAGSLHGRGSGDRLCLRFADSMLTLESVIRLLSTRAMPAREVAFGFDFMGKFAHLSSGMWNPDDVPLYDGPDPKMGQHRPAFMFLQLLAGSLKFRSVTVPTDEVVCLATLLGLRIGRTHGAVPLIGDGKTPEEGMCELWRTVAAQHGGGIPADIVFSSVPRIEVPGFRWAPRTIIEHAKYGRLYIAGTEEPGRITDGGLVVRFLGARLKYMESPDQYGDFLFKKVPEGWFSGDTGYEGKTRPTNTLMVQMPSGSGGWFVVQVMRDGNKAQEGDQHGKRRPDLPELLKSGTGALIFREPSHSGVGLLVTTASKLPSPDFGVGINSPIQVRTEYPVIVTALAPHSSFIASGARRCISRLAAVAAKSVAPAAASAGLPSSLSPEAAVPDPMNDEEAMAALVRRTAEETVAETERLADALYFEELSRKATVTREAILESFVKYVDTFARCGGLGGELTATDQLWCVD